MASKVVDNSTAQKWVERQLGGGMINIELTCDQFTDCLDNAFRWFNDKRGIRGEYKIQLYPNISEYSLAAIQPNVETVLEVAFVNSSDIDLRAIYGDDLALPGIPWGQFPYGALQSGTYSSLVQAMQYRKTARNVMSADLDWTFRKVKDPGNPTAAPIPRLYITPGVNGPQGDCIILYKARLEKIEDIVTDDRNLYFVLERAKAEAMNVLGRVRGKYKSYPTVGGERSLDGDDLRQEAKELMEKLDTDISMVNMPMPFLVK